jgi:hypothetical protein
MEFAALRDGSIIGAISVCSRDRSRGGGIAARRRLGLEPEARGAAPFGTR